MQIKDLMTREVELIGPMTMIKDASRMMRDDDLGMLPVAKDDRLVGTLTDRDIVVRAVAEGKDPSQTPVGDVMSERVLYCFDDQTAKEVAENMGGNQIRRLPVLNRDKRLVGIVSLGDLSVGGPADQAGEALGRISEPGH